MILFIYLIINYYNTTWPLLLYCKKVQLRALDPKRSTLRRPANQPHLQASGSFDLVRGGQGRQIVGWSLDNHFFLLGCCFQKLS